ncbi:MAG: GNAT family N-acetyltransferase [Anaerolineales bacterium]|jgi:RimJ/RimL family protein N-acetyltransferase
MTKKLTYQALTSRNWDDFEALFGSRGAYGGCWCMWWRKTRREFERDQGQANKEHMRSIVERGVKPGILVYHDQTPIGWCSIAPRKDFASLERSPVLKRLDDEPVWSLVCIFIDGGWRGLGAAVEVVSLAVAYAFNNGAEIVEAYPTVTNGQKRAPVSIFMGTPHVFDQAGFVVCKQASKSKLIMRCSRSGKSYGEEED